MKLRTSAPKIEYGKNINKLYSIPLSWNKRVYFFSDSSVIIFYEDNKKYCVVSMYNCHFFHKNIIYFIYKKKLLCGWVDVNFLKIFV